MENPSTPWANHAVTSATPPALSATTLGEYMGSVAKKHAKPTKSATARVSEGTCAPAAPDAAPSPWTPAAPRMSPSLSAAPARAPRSPAAPPAPRATAPRPAPAPPASPVSAAPRTPAPRLSCTPQVSPARAPARASRESAGVPAVFPVMPAPCPPGAHMSAPAYQNACSQAVNTNILRSLAHSRYFAPGPRIPSLSDSISRPRAPLCVLSPPGAAHMPHTSGISLLQRSSLQWK